VSSMGAVFPLRSGRTARQTLSRAGDVSVETVANIVGVLGLLLAVVGLGGLTGSWWLALMVGGLVMTGVAVVIQLNTRPAVAPAEVASDAPAPARRPAAA